MYMEYEEKWKSERCGPGSDDGAAALWEEMEERHGGIVT